MTPLSKAKELLEVLNVEEISGINIDTSSIHAIQHFWNLVDLNIEVLCHDEGGRSQCIFKLNNGNVTELAMALTQLEYLFLGHPCFETTCLTTVACLLPTPVHCNKLKKLEVHFNTTNIVDIFKNISEDPRFQQLCSLPRCPLMRLDVDRIPLSLDESDFETVVKGMIDIFPSLTHCEGLERSWDEFSRRITDLQEDSE